MQNVNKNIMSLPKQPALKEEDEDEVITQIKTIASEIFDYDLQGVDGMGIELGLLALCNASKNKAKNYSYTERRPTEDRQQCQSQWISYENFEKLNNGEVQEIAHNVKPKPEAMKNAKDKKNRPPKQIKPNPRSPAKEIKKKNLKKENKNVQEGNNLQVEPKNHIVNKIKIQNLQQYGFMKQTGKVKEEIVNELYKKQQKDAQQLKRPKKHFKTLEELYSQKQPLYDKYLKQKEKKVKAIYESRVSEEQKLQDMVSNPEINRNIVVEGSFQDRLKESGRKTQQNRSKIMSQMLEGSTFKPQTNKSQKFKKVQSVVKNSWKKKNNSDQKQEISLENSKFSVYKNQNKANFKLKSAYELGHILQIDDNFGE